jgi:predicted anti-sigma-YlaC factor YlaD
MMLTARSPDSTAPRLRDLARLAAVLLTAAVLSGCSVRKFAINKLGDSLANGGGTTWSGDNDPEFIGDAVPFSLKLIESLLAESPNHQGLLFAAASGYTQYSYVYLQLPAEQAEVDNVTTAAALRDRSRNLYFRARDYGLRGLDSRHKGFSAALKENPAQAVKLATFKDFPLFYWTAASWGAAISISKDHPDIVADQPKVEALIDRAYQLSPDFEHGAIDTFFISYEGARQGAKGDFAERCKMHFDRAVKLTDGQMASPYVSYAENVAVKQQNRADFESLLKQALAIDPNNRIEWRLSNTVMQRRAVWLLSREDDLFVDPVPGGVSQ